MQRTIKLRWKMNHDRVNVVTYMRRYFLFRRNEIHIDSKIHNPTPVL
jgi:hypothetical protein